MNVSDLALRLVILFVPGIIAAIIIEHLIVTPKWSGFRFGTYSLLLGSIAYLLHQVFLYCVAGIRLLLGEPFTPGTIQFWHALFDEKATIPPLEVIEACGFSILLAILVATAVQHKWLTRFARRVGVSDKYGDENLYSYFLNAKETSWVWVRDREAGLIYEGLRDSYSEAGGAREIVLTKVKVFEDEESKLLYEVPVTYLSFPAGRLEIEFAVTPEDPDGTKGKAIERGSAEESNAKDGQSPSAAGEPPASIQSA